MDQKQDKRLKDAIELAWKEVKPRAGDRFAVRETLTRMIGMLARRQPPLSAEQMKDLAVPMLFKTYDEPEAGPDPAVPKKRRTAVKVEGVLKAAKKKSKKLA